MLASTTGIAIACYTKVCRAMTELHEATTESSLMSNRREPCHVKINHLEGR